MHVLQVNARDIGSGAERIAWMLFKGLQDRGYSSAMAVGFKSGDDDGIRVIPGGARYGRLRTYLWRIQQRLAESGNRARGAWRLSRLVRALLEPGSILDACRGREDYRYPGTWRLLDPPRPDIIHFHNLHGDYFDLRALPRLSGQVPALITLHDMWMLTGLCIYSFSCERWERGCGNCPLLHMRPSLIPAAWRRDATQENREQKRGIYARSRLHLAAPSAWLMQQARRSILAPATIESRVIPNGVDLTVFHPESRQSARDRLGIPQGTPVILTVAAAILGNVAKGFGLISEAMTLLAAQRRGPRLLLLALGANAPSRSAEGLEIRFAPFKKDPQDVARYYQAADIYVHGAVQDNFPNTVLEALACGTPVAATAVGGIPEQVKPAQVPGLISAADEGLSERSRVGEATGTLVLPGRPADMAHAVGWMLDHDAVRHRMAENAAIDAKNRFGLERQLDAYVDFYESMIARSQYEAREEPSGLNDLESQRAPI